MPGGEYQMAFLVGLGGKPEQCVDTIKFFRVCKQLEKTWTPASLPCHYQTRNTFSKSKPRRCLFAVLGNTQPSKQLQQASKDVSIFEESQQTKRMSTCVPPRTVVVRSSLPIVAIVGRPNVGKSTLLNRLARNFKFGSIAEDVPGITRDRTYHPAFWNGVDFELVDTGGLVFEESREKIPFLKEIREQALLAMNEAMATIVVVDCTTGITDLDIQIANFVRKHRTPVVVAVNKCDQEQRYLEAFEFWKLGLGEPIPVSGLHGNGTGELLDRLVEEILEQRRKTLSSTSSTTPMIDMTTAKRIAIVGRPNAGKSSILNRLVGEPRAIVSDIPGTTRDTIDTTVERDNQVYILMDTAGIRRKKMVEYGTEFFMINRAFKAIRRADVVILVVDAVADIVEQDQKLAERIANEGHGCIVVINKWDLVEKDQHTYEKAKEYVATQLPSVSWAPTLFISASTGQRCERIFEVVDAVYEQYTRRVSTSVLNQVLQEAVTWNMPPTNRQGKQGKVYYCTQVSSKPPSIAVFVNDPKLFKDNYRKYLENHFRKSLGFEGTPLRLLWRGKKRPPPV
eukprot:jgi/Galph1/4922/GphlegSOOS_G3564.1